MTGTVKSTIVKFQRSFFKLLVIVRGASFYRRYVLLGSAGVEAVPPGRAGVEVVPLIYVRVNIVLENFQKLGF